MKNYTKKAAIFFKRPRNLVIGIIVLGIVLFFILGGKKQPVNNLITIKRGSVVQDIVVTGDITSEENVDLSFPVGGNISKIFVATGDKVGTGDILLAEDASVLEAQLQQAEASVAADEANLATLESGATPEDVSVSEAEVASAESALADAKRAAVNAIKDAYTKADDAVHNQTDQIFTNPRTSNPQLLFTIPDQQLTVNIDAERVGVESDFSAWSTALQSLGSSDDLLPVIKQTKAYLDDIQSFLTDVASALNVANPSTGATQAALSSWKTAVAAGRTETGTTLTNVIGVESSLNAAETALTVAQKQLALKQAPATADQVAAEEAQVEQAKANVAVIQAQINQMVLESPLSGIVTNVVPKKGEVVTAGETVVSIMGINSLEVEAYVAEADVAKLTVGDPVSMTFDALPGENFTGKVFSIDPAETVLNGVANYKIKVSFDKMDPRFKSGLTANLTIETERKDGVLVAPQFAIIQNDQGTFATKVVNGKEEQVPIILGIQDQNGNAEVVSGLSEGDQVLNVGLKQQ